MVETREILRLALRISLGTVGHTFLSLREAFRDRSGYAAKVIDLSTIAGTRFGVVTATTAAASTETGLLSRSTTNEALIVLSGADVPFPLGTDYPTNHFVVAADTDTVLMGRLTLITRVCKGALFEKGRAYY